MGLTHPSLVEAVLALQSLKTQSAPEPWLRYHCRSDSGSGHCFARTAGPYQGMIRA